MTRSIPAAALSVLLLLAVSACTSGTPAPASKSPEGSPAVEPHQVRIGGSVVSLQGASVTKDFFAGANVQPLVGRFFIEGDFAAPAPSTVVLSNQTWTDRFGASPTAIGQAIEIDSHLSTIVGIAPKDFDVPSGAQFWMPKKP